MKKLKFLVMVLILSSCGDPPMDAGYKNVLIIENIILSKVPAKNAGGQKEFNKKCISRLPNEFINRLGSKCVDNLHLVKYMQSATSAPIPSFTLELTFINGKVEKYEFPEGEVTYREFNFNSQELFGMRVDSIVDNIYLALIEAQCNYIKQNSDKIPHTITEDRANN